MIHVIPVPFCPQWVAYLPSSFTETVNVSLKIYLIPVPCSKCVSKRERTCGSTLKPHLPVFISHLHSGLFQKIFGHVPSSLILQSLVKSCEVCTCTVLSKMGCSGCTFAVVIITYPMGSIACIILYVVIVDFLIK